MTSLGKIFLRGLITLFPIALTVYILYSAFVILDGIFGGLFKKILPNYIPGLGLAAIIVATFLFGLMLNSLIIGKGLAYAEKKLLEVPLIRAVYSPLKDLMNLFSKKGGKDAQQVVFVKLGPTGLMQLGLMTRENFDELNLGEPFEKMVAVYFPFSYALGGYTILVPKSEVIPSHLPIEKAMSLAITGWVKTETKSSELQ